MRAATPAKNARIARVMTWDRADDAFDDQRYGTIYQLLHQINELEANLWAHGIAVCTWTPPCEEPGSHGFTVLAERTAPFGRTLQVQALLEKSRPH